MSAIARVNNLISLSLSRIALNPVVTASLLWVLTNGPPQVRDRLLNRFASLRDPQRLARIAKALKALLALGLLGTVNRQLNKIALNAWRIRSEKKRWQFSQEIAVVTGGCSGIGELIVKGLVKKGVTIAILDIQHLPASLQGYANIKFYACDITDANAVHSAADQIRKDIGSPSILINNAGIAHAHTILNTSDEFLRNIFGVNVLSNFTTVKAFLPDMIAKNKGHIVTIASLASYISLAGMADYGCTKAAVLHFHECLTQELKLHHKVPGVLTTSVHPNWARTPLIQSYEAALRASGNPIIEPQEVADAVVKQIMSCSSAQLFVPRSLAWTSLLKGLPNWFQELFRSVPGKQVLQSVEK